jgi:hypothetical protein
MHCSMNSWTCGIDIAVFVRGTGETSLNTWIWFDWVSGIWSSRKQNVKFLSMITYNVSSSSSSLRYMMVDVMGLENDGLGQRNELISYMHQLISRTNSHPIDLLLRSLRPRLWVPVKLTMTVVLASSRCPPKSSSLSHSMLGKSSSSET